MKRRARSCGLDPDPASRGVNAAPPQARHRRLGRRHGHDARDRSDRVTRTL